MLRVVRRAALTACAAASLLAPACTAAPPAPPSPDSVRGPGLPVDSARAGSPEVVAAWAHRQAIDVDLDADGAPERVILTADVELDGRGRPLWEDGHRWAVLVEDDGRRTLVYSAFVPNGTAEAALVATGSTPPARRVLVVERTPQQVRTLVVAYDGPGRASLVSASEHLVEQWLPSLHGAAR